MGKNSRNGLIALALSALAFWKWGMKPEDKAKVKDELSKAGQKLKDQAQGLESKVNTAVNEGEQNAAPQS